MFYISNYVLTSVMLLKCNAEIIASPYYLCGAQFETESVSLLCFVIERYFLQSLKTGFFNTSHLITPNSSLSHL
jgi:hypothetical protein